MKMPEKNPLEWTVFAISTLLVLAIIGYLLWMSFRLEPEVEGLRVTLGEPTPQPESNPPSFAVPVTVYNPGDRPVADVEVEVTLERPGSEPEQANLTLPLIPIRSSRAGVVLFTGEPEGAVLSGRVIGYLQP